MIPNEGFDQAIQTHLAPMCSNCHLLKQLLYGSNHRIPLRCECSRAHPPTLVLCKTRSHPSSLLPACHMHCCPLSRDVHLPWPDMNDPHRMKPPLFVSKKCSSWAHLGFFTTHPSNLVTKTSMSGICAQDQAVRTSHPPIRKAQCEPSYSRLPFLN